jgi:hypothetical protein
MRCNRLLTLGALAVLLAAMLFAWEQHPYRGGKARFTAYFGITLPESIQQIPIELSGGSFWDDPRFRFHLKRSEFDTFKILADGAGFSLWKPQGGQYGSFNEESNISNPLFYSEKQLGTCKTMLFYRPSTETLDAVTFYH